MAAVASSAGERLTSERSQKVRLSRSAEGERPGPLAGRRLQTATAVRRPCELALPSPVCPFTDLLQSSARVTGSASSALCLLESAEAGEGKDSAFRCSRHLR